MASGSCGRDNRIGREIANAHREEQQSEQSTDIGQRTHPMLLHKRRVSERMRCGKDQAQLCHDCYNCVRKARHEMPVNALANGRWLGRHPVNMRSMPYGHRWLLPVRRVVLTRVIFTANPKSEWEISHSQKGLHGVTAVVEQAEASSSILEYPPGSLGESFQVVVLASILMTLEKAQGFPIKKAWFLAQHEFLQKHSVPNGAARINANVVEAWADGVTPSGTSKQFCRCTQPSRGR